MSHPSSGEAPASLTYLRVRLGTKSTGTPRQVTLHCPLFAPSVKSEFLPRSSRVTALHTSIAWLSIPSPVLSHAIWRGWELALTRQQSEMQPIHHSKSALSRTAEDYS